MNETLDDDARAAADRGSPPGIPLWVKVLGAAAIVFVVLFAAMHLGGITIGGHMGGHMGGHR